MYVLLTELNVSGEMCSQQSHATSTMYYTSWKGMVYLTCPVVFIYSAAIMFLFPACKPSLMDSEMAWTITPFQLREIALLINCGTWVYSTTLKSTMMRYMFVNYTQNSMHLWQMKY